MKKKILIILCLTFVLIFTSGCTANYTLKYEDDIFTEYLQVTGEAEDEAHPTYNAIKESGLYADRDGTEQFVLDPSSSRYDVKLEHELEQTKLEDLKAVSECFNLSTYKETETSYYLSLYGGFICPYLSEDSTFVLETSAEVITHNAHEQEEEKYIWNLNEDDLSEEGITFQIIKTTVEEPSVVGDSMFPLWLRILLIVIIAGVGIGLIYLLKKSTER